MGRDSHSQARPDSVRELQTFWDGCILIDIGSADYDCTTGDLADFWVRGIESGDTSGGAVIVLDYSDEASATKERTSQSIAVKEGICKCPFPFIKKIHKTASGTTAAAIRLYYQRKRA